MLGGCRSWAGDGRSWIGVVARGRGWSFVVGDRRSWWEDRRPCGVVVRVGRGRL